MTKKQRRQQGFTLIEIIAVIILLGVLAATVIPKFSDLTADAKKAAAKQAVAEGIARVNQGAAKYILDTTTVPANLAALGTAYLGADSTDAGDYQLAYADGTNTGEIDITATDKADSTATASGIAYLPEAQ